LPIYGTVLILAVAYITRYLPVALRTVSGGLIQLSNEFEEAARMTGAGWGRTFVRIILPLMRPALAAAWLLMFMTFVRELGMSILLVGRGNAVLSVVMFDYYTSGEQGLLAAASVLLMLMILTVVVIARQVFEIRFSRFGAA
jgi:iron(III) transport system permease protein